MLWDAVYIHAPFCARKCPYCDFYSLPAKAYDISVYLSSLQSAIAQSASLAGRAGSIDTIYFGGGTPTLLGAHGIGALLEKINDSFSIGRNAEITIECNPGAIPAGLLEELRAAGVNRLSIGMQSCSKRELEFLGRAHTHDQTRRALKSARRAGFTDISCDLILALPGQTELDIKKSIEQCAGMGADHISAYLLKIEDNTPFAKKGVDALCPDDEKTAGLYLAAEEMMRWYGFLQYEISSFAHEGHRGRHNEKYWDCLPYLGLGPSAHSFIGGRRRSFPRDIAAFNDACGKNSAFGSIWLDNGSGGEIEEYLMLRLRLTDGINFDALSRRFPSFSRLEALLERGAALAREGLARVTSGGLSLTARGMLVSNQAILYLLDGI